MLNVSMKHYSLPVIQLEEVPPPTPRPVPSLVQSTSYFSSSAGSDDDEQESEMDLDDDPQDDLQSYCSSDVVRDADPALPQSQLPIQRCIKRILQWRERSYDCADSDPSTPRLDTTTPPNTFDDPQLFKRTSSSSSSASTSSTLSTSSSFADPSPFLIASRRYSNTSSITSAELEFLPCPACDAFFPTHDSLRAHGLATGNEACCVAVEYAFEK